MPWYVYGVTRPDGGPLPDGLMGVDDAPVEILGDGHLQAVTSEVSAGFGHLAEADDEDVVAAVRRHDDVLREVARDRTLLPVRFGTVLADDAAIEWLLADPDGTLDAALRQIDGADEWVLTVTAVNPDTTTAPDEPDLSPGHAFFARRRSAEQQRERARSSAVAVAREVDARLRELARDFRPLDLRGPDVVARGAYLVPRDVSDQFIEATQSHGEGIIEIQGPLPPYRFAEPTS